MYIMTKVCDVDVLIVGGGLAGLSAALVAREHFLKVGLVCKSKAGKSGNTLVSGGALSVATDEGGCGDDPSILEKDVLDSGAGINNTELVRVFAEESGSVIPFLREHGVEFKSIDGKPLVKQPPGHSIRRSFPSEYRSYSYLNRGLPLTLPLLEKALEGGVRVFDETTVIKLLTDEKGIVGAVALENNSGEKILFSSQVIILAAGGGARLFEYNNNTADVSCDSYRLAYEAGAVMRDMEMVQFYPSMMYSPIKMPLSNPLFGDGAVLKNIEGEEFMYRYSEKGNLATRDVMALAVKTEIDEGRGNPDNVFMDCSKIDPDVLDKKYEELTKILQEAGLDIKKDLLPLAPAAHFYIGGVDVDCECRTSVDGLLACGEASGGLHGANRLSGIALAETVVFGRIAGKTAADICKRSFKTSALTEPEEIILPQSRSGDFSLQSLMEELRLVMWEQASITRNEETLRCAKNELKRIIKQKDMARVENIRDILCFHQLESMISEARILIEVSEKRKESRGAFFRTDYPEKNEKFKGNFFVKKNTNGDMECYFRMAE